MTAAAKSRSTRNTEENDRIARKHYHIVVLSLALVIYPLWTVIHLFLIPQVSVAIALRATIVIALMIGLWMAKNDRFADGKIIDYVIFAAFCGMVLHAFLVYMENVQNQVILWRVFILVATISVVLISQRQLALLMGLVMVLSGVTYLRGPDPMMYLFFVLGLLTFFSAIWFTQPMRTWTIQALRVSNSEIRSLADQQRVLIGRLSHDLRTPLLPLTALLPRIESRVQGDPKTKEMVALVMRNAAYMRNLVERTLTYTKVSSETEKLEPDDFNISDLAKETIGTFTVTEHRSPMSFVNKVPPDLEGHGDIYRILEVLYNLISNAIRYMPDGGTVTIDAREDGEAIWISVTDTGIGMSGEQLKHVFAPFYKADNARSDHSSVGLGLVICQQIVKMHGQQIVVESSGLGRGTTVRFSVRKAK